MGKLDRAVEIAVDQVGVGLPARGERRTRAQTAAFLALTHDPDPVVRRVAVRNLCPCHVQGDVPEVWDRLLELVDDPDEHVRDEVLHTLVDGSPRRLREAVVAVLERKVRDRTVKRSRRRFLSDALRRFHRTGMLDPHA